MVEMVNYTVKLKTNFTKFYSTLTVPKAGISLGVTATLVKLLLVIRNICVLLSTVSAVTVALRSTRKIDIWFNIRRK